MKTLTKHYPVAAILRDFTDALAQQMFYWGRDVIHPSGNLLVARGFDRRKSGGLDGTSCYRLRLEGGFVELHGACAGWYPENSGEPGFLYIRKRHRCYLYEGSEPPAPGLYDNELLRTSPGAELLERSRHFLDWWLSYEAWIAELNGPDYRNSCHRTFAKLPKSVPWLPPAAALDWLRAYHCDPEAAARARRKS